MNMEDLFTKECGILEIQADRIILGDCIKIKMRVADGEIRVGDDLEWEELPYFPGEYQKAKIQSISSAGVSLDRASEGMTVDILLSGNIQTKYLRSGVSNLEIQADPVILGDCVKIKVCVVDGKIHAGDDVEWLSYYPKAYQKAKIESIHSDDVSINRAAEGMTVDILLSGNSQAKYLHRDNSAEDAKIILLDLRVNPVVVVARDGTFSK